MERTRRKSKSVGSLVVWTVFLLMWIQISVAPSVLATSHLALLATGSTSCDNVTCDAGTEGIIPWIVYIDDGDDLYFYYNVSWNDVRPSNSTVAYHNFTLTVRYNDIPYSGAKRIETYGNTYGRDTILIVLFDMDDGQWIFVQWDAGIYVTSTLCADYSSKGPIGIYLM